MSLRRRKITVAIAMAVVLVLANVWRIATWLETAGVVGFAKYVRREFLTGTAIAIIVVLLVLLMPSAGQLLRRCRVCQRLLLGSARYCARCGSKAT